jgi:integrase
MNRLTVLAVKNAKKKGRHADGGGLYLQVSSTGAKSWVYRYMLNRRVREIGLGPLHAFTLADARAKAAEARKLKWQGTDPLEEKRQSRAEEKGAVAQPLTFKDAATAYCAGHRSGWRNQKHADQWSHTLEKHAYPVFGDLAVSMVDVGHVMKAIEPIWTRIPETANRVRGRIEAILDWAKARGYRQGENPARWRGHLDNLLPAPGKVRRVQHFAALPYVEIGAFMAALRHHTGLAAKALELLILTATRTGETLGARWSEIDLDQAVWIIPGKRTKMGKEHRVPLSAAAIALLRRIADEHTDEELVFPGTKSGKSLSNMAMLKVLERMKLDVTVHGFRSCFRDWAAEQTDHGRDVAEMALAHTIESKAEAAYRRGDLFMKRKALMEDWAKYCERVHESASVMELPKRAVDAA